MGWNVVIGADNFKAGSVSRGSSLVMTSKYKIGLSNNQYGVVEVIPIFTTSVHLLV